MLSGLKDFFELSPDIFCIAGVDGFFKMINQAFLEKTGWSREELLDKPFFNFIHPDDKKKTQHTIDTITTAHPTFVFENRIFCKNGSYKYFLWYGYVHSKKGFYYMVARDNTDLKHSKDMSRSAIEASPSGVIMVDQGGIITMANLQAEKYFGYSRDELIGLSVEKLIPINKERHRQYRNGFLNNPKARPMGAEKDLSAVRKNGQTFPVEIGLNPIQLHEETFIMATIIDITERKKGEETLRAAKEEAEKANQLKSEFLNLMSHELRTPLTVMLGNLPLLTDPEDLPDKEDIAEIASDVEESGKHLLTLINDLLDISKIEAGKLELNIKAISVKDLVSNVLASIKTLADAKGLKLESEVEDCEIAADVIRMKQILLNLLSNAVKFSDEGCILVKAYKEGGQVVFEVRDSGSGIRKEDIPLLFNMFQQVDNSSTRKAQGSGLGLLITKKLVNLHGGEISVESVLGHGSTFRFTIPC